MASNTGSGVVPLPAEEKDHADYSKSSAENADKLSTKTSSGHPHKTQGIGSAESSPASEESERANEGANKRQSGSKADRAIGPELQLIPISKDPRWMSMAPDGLSTFELAVSNYLHLIAEFAADPGPIDGENIEQSIVPVNQTKDWIHLPLAGLSNFQLMVLNNLNLFAEDSAERRRLEVALAWSNHNLLSAKKE